MSHSIHKHWSDQALYLRSLGYPVALITLIDVRGSAPREAGARMLVWQDGELDTVGGGNLEMMLMRAARDMLDQGGGPIEREYPLGPALGQCCGGRVKARIEVLGDEHEAWLKRESDNEYFTMPQLYVFGAGHVGKVLASAAEALPFKLHWLDTRLDYARGADLTNDPERDVEAAREGSYFVIATHNHDLDYAIVRAVLARRDAAYCGLIGSKTKRARFERQLRAGGLGGVIDKLVCPIGASIGLTGKAPGVIAAATIAEILLVWEAQRAGAAKEHAHAE